MLHALFCDKKKRWPRLGKNDSHYRNFRRPTLFGSPQTAYFCSIKNNKKIAVDTLDSSKAKSLGFKYPKEVRRTIGASEINHTLSRHGAKSQLVQKSGQKEVKLDDISQWTKYADTADKHIISKDDLGQEVLVSAKQINGYYVIVESIRKKHNELAFKTMYFENGKIQDNEMFK